MNKLTPVIALLFISSSAIASSHATVTGDFKQGEHYEAHNVPKSYKLDKHDATPKKSAYTFVTAQAFPAHGQPNKYFMAHGKTTAYIRNDNSNTKTYYIKTDICTNNSCDIAQDTYFVDGNGGVLNYAMEIDIDTMVFEAGTYDDECTINVWGAETAVMSSKSTVIIS